MMVKCLFYLFVFLIIYSGIHAIVTKRTTTYPGLLSTRPVPVFNNAASVFWGFGLVILGSAILIWSVKPEYFQHPIFSLINCVIVYGVLYVVAGIIQFIQDILSKRQN